MVHNTRVFVGNKGIAELGPRGFRLLPDGSWEPLRLDHSRGAARIRALLTEAVAPLPAGATAERSHGQPAGTCTPENWAIALGVRGVPARVDGPRVRVPGIGPIDVPASESLKNAARRFVRVQTRAALPELTSAISEALGSRMGHVQIATAKSGLTLHVNGKHVAAVNRFGFNAKGVAWSGDVLASPGVLRKLRPPIDRALARTATSRIPPAAHASSPPSRKLQPPRRAPARRPPPERRPPPPPEEPDLRFDFPDSLSPTACDRAMQASGRLRAERTLVPAVAVEVPTPHGTLTFEPLNETAKPLEARFAFHRGRTQFSGGLRLKRPGDPLTLRVDKGSAEPLTAEAWAAALIVYAELTCVDIPADPVPQPTTLTPRSPRPPQTSTFTSSPRRAPGTRRPGASWRPTIERSALRDAIDQIRAVSGHLRRLRSGARASDEAIRAAERAGIRVPSGYTWVRPHGRGPQPIVRVQWPSAGRLW